MHSTVAAIPRVFANGYALTFDSPETPIFSAILDPFTGFPLFPIIVIFLGVSLVFGVTQFLRRYNWKQANDLHRFGLAAGALTPLIVFAPLQELDQTRTDNPTGMGLVGLAFLIGLVWLGWQIRKRTQAMRKTDGDYN
jgi:hypothetical protein